MLGSVSCGDILRREVEEAYLLLVSHELISLEQGRELVRTWEKKKRAYVVGVASVVVACTSQHYTER